MGENLDVIKIVFNKAVEEAYSRGFADGKADVSKHSLDELHDSGQVKYVGNDSGYNHLTTGKIYTILEKMFHPSEEFLVLKIMDDRNLDSIGSFISQKTAYLFEAVKQPEQVPIVKELTANQQRSALIERERIFLKEHEVDKPGELELRSYGNKTCRHHYETDFVVKGGKVTALVFRLYPKDRQSSSPSNIGRAICTDGDIKNVILGKSIALRKALEIDIPQDLINAVQPDEVVVGMKVLILDSTGNSLGYSREVERVSERPSHEDGKLYPTFRNGGWASEYIIIDDTNAEYGHGE